MFARGKFYIGNILYAVFNTSLIYSVLTPYIRSTGINPLQLSTMQTAESFVWFVCMYLSGIVFDRFGAKISFLLGRIIDLFSIFLLFKPTFYNLLVFYVFLGVSKGTIYGKYESYMYNYLSANGQLKLYPKIASFYYFFWDISLSMMAFISSIILKYHDYNILIWITIFFKIIALFSVIFFVQGVKNSELQQFTNTSIIQIFQKVYQCIKNSKGFLYLLLFYGLINFFTYPLCLVIGDMVLVDMGFNGKQIALYTSVFMAVMAIGTFIPILVIQNGIKIKTCLYISLCQIFFLIIASLLYLPYCFILSAILIIVPFTLIEVSVEKHFEKYSDKKIRGSAISLSLSIGTLFRMFNVMLIGFIAKNYSYYIGLLVVVVPVFLILLFLLYKLKDIDE